MSDIEFNCPHCQQVLEAPEDMAGQEIPCPACEKTLAIPAPAEPKRKLTIAKTEPPKAHGSALPEAAATPTGPMVPCPGCGVDIPEVAILCVACGFDTRTGKKIETIL